jgi:hypothetical protein
MQIFDSDEELKEFMEYFKNELPDPEHHPLKVIWLVKWWQGIVQRNKEDEQNI